MVVRNYPHPQSRREALEKELATSLPYIASYTPDLDIASTKNCENMIGAVQVPIGIAGPLKINSPDDGQKSKIKNYYLPLATTEGALVASISRGCKAITMAGGAIVDVSKAGITRGPVFHTSSVADRKKLYDYIKNQKTKIKKVSESTSKHVALRDIMVKSLAHYTFVRFSYDTEDAMGMNMATIATQEAVELIEQETGIRCLSVAGNFDIDKKPAWLNSIMERGIKAWAEVVLQKRILRDVLKTTPEKFFEVWLAKCMLGSAVAGSVGFNAHIANVIAAIFIATGQDPAHVVEGSLGITTAKVLASGDLHVGVFLPSLLVGTVGGGTVLPTQGEALRILGVFGEGKVEEFAGIVTAACLAGEISLLASLSEGSLARAHRRLGRGE